MIETEVLLTKYSPLCENKGRVTLDPTTAEYLFSASPHKILSGIDDMLAHKTNLNKF